MIICRECKCPRGSNALVGCPGCIEDSHEKELADLRAQLEACQKEKTAAQTLNREWNRAMSEFAAGSEYIDDPKRVASHLKDARKLHELIVGKKCDVLLALLRDALVDIRSRDMCSLPNCEDQNCIAKGALIERITAALAAHKEPV